MITGMVVFASLFLAELLAGATTTWAQAAAPPPAKPGAAPPKTAAPADSAASPGIPVMSDAAKRTAELRASLDTLRVTLDIQKRKLSDAVRALASSQAKVNIVLDDTLPAAVRDREVTLSLHNVSLRHAVTSLAKPDLTFEVLHEAICISTREGIADLVASAPIIPDDLIPEGKALVVAMRSKLISFSFENTRFQDAVSVLSQLTAVKITVDPAIAPEKLRPVTLSLADVHLGPALFYVTGKDLNAAVSLGAFFISTNEGVQKELARRKVVLKRRAENEKFGSLLQTPVTCQFTKTPLNDAAAEIARLAKAKIVFDPAALQQVGSKTLVTDKLENVPLATALARILPEKLDYSVNDEGVIEIDLKAPKKPEKPPVPVKKGK
jgi:hypothetical protein